MSDKILEFEKYMQHLPSCNILNTKVWAEAFEALSYCSDEPEKELAYEDMRVKMQICTCGMEECLKETKGAYFTPDQIRIIEEQAYDAGIRSLAELH